MKYFLIGLAAVLLLTSHRTANAVSLKHCTAVTQRSSIDPGRFIWKPSAAHFPDKVALVTPRYYFPEPPIVELLQDKESYPLIERAAMKSTGYCPGNPECMWAASYLSGRSAAFYQRRYKKLIVKVYSAPGDTPKECRYYKIRRPVNRFEYVG